MQPVHGLNDGIEPFGIADLQGTFMSSSQFEHVPGLGQRGGNRFFHQDPDAAGQKRFGNRRMKLRRDRHRHHIDQREDFFGQAIRPAAELLDQLSGFGKLGIHHRHQFNLRHLAIDAAVQPSHTARPNHTGS
ncbi:MAG: hypothetical protein BWY71_02278 [Planctomycetes bacterium ADurb.Bin412]|nr:MAG: hypothetical protein BWY71_02278 [Planctomycetes bacterium ADurb.Bin412]